MQMSTQFSKKNAAAVGSNFLFFWKNLLTNIAYPVTEKGFFLVFFLFFTNFLDTYEVSQNKGSLRFFLPFLTETLYAIFHFFRKNYRNKKFCSRACEFPRRVAWKVRLFCCTPIPRPKL